MGISQVFSVGLKGMNTRQNLMTQKDDWQIESANMDKELIFFIIAKVSGGFFF